MSTPPTLPDPDVDPPVAVETPPGAPDGGDGLGGSGFGGELSAATDEAELGKRAANSSFWTVGGIGAMNLVRLASNMVLAYLIIDRGQFGLSLLVATVIMALGMFSDVGVGPCIVASKRGDDPKFLNTAWSIQILRGFLLFGVGLLVAEPLAEFYASGDEDWAQLSGLLSAGVFVTILQGFNSTKIFTAERHLALAKKVQGDMFGQVCAVVTMIAWASADPTARAMVAGMLVQAAGVMAWSHWKIPGERNALQFDAAAAKELFRFGRWIFVSTLITFFALQIDRLILPKTEGTGTDQVGVYGIAMGITNLPQFILGVLTGTVIFPLLATYARSAPEVLREKFIGQRQTLLIGAMALSLAVGLLARPFFQLYPVRYADAGWIAALFMISAWFFMLTVTADRALLARGHTRVLAVSNLASFVGKFAGAWIGFQYYGMPGFLLGLTLGTVLGHLVIQYALHADGLPILSQDLVFTAIAAALALTGVGAQQLALQYVDGWPKFFVHSAIGVAVVAPLLVLLYRRLRRVGITA